MLSPEIVAAALEYTAVAFGIVCVWLTVRQNVWCWPTGLVQVSLFIVIFYQAKLYSDVILHIIYVFLGIYGWYHWVRGGTRSNPLPVTRLSPASLAGFLLLTVGGTLVLGYVMETRTDASFPYGDAFTTAASLVAQWLLARKKLESWGFWIVVDVVAIGIYYAKGLYPTAGLYSAFLVLATLGLFAWRSSWRSGPVEEPAS